MSTINVNQSSFSLHADVSEIIRTLLQVSSSRQRSYRDSLSTITDIFREQQSTAIQAKATAQKSTYNLPIGSFGAALPIITALVSAAGNLSPGAAAACSAFGQSIQQGSSVLINSYDNSKNSSVTLYDYRADSVRRIMDEQSESIRSTQQDAQQLENLIRESMQQEIRTAESITTTT